MDLRPWQARFVRRALAPEVRTAALSLPRGNGKSTLAAWLGARFLTPGDPLHLPGAEAHLAAASIGQARRTTFRLLREHLPEGGYRFAESYNICHAVHVSTNTRVSVLASSGKTAQGLVRCPFLVADEPGAWEVNGGEVLHDAIQTAQGKPGSSLRAIYIGTLAPSRGGWWHDLIGDGSAGSTYVQVLQGRPDRWDRAPEIRRCNPLMWAFPESRATLLEERDKARRDPRKKAAFLSYRLNLPTPDESRVLISVDDWQVVVARPAAPREGRPVVGVDLGGGRSWSAAVAIWPATMRVEVAALAPGVPTLQEQERRDRRPRGLYARIVEDGVLQVAEGLRVPPVARLVDVVLGWQPAAVLCDRFRLGELLDAVRGRVQVVGRVSRWSESSEDIRAVRELATDGGMSVSPEARRLLAHSIGQSSVATDDAGNARLVKSQWRSGSDDAAVALSLAAGEAWRRRRRPAPTVRWAVSG